MRPSDIKACLFDVFGTVVDWRSSVSRDLAQFAREKGCTPGQLALAWLLARGPDIVPIPGTKRRDRLEENVGALDVRLTAAEVERLSDAIPAGAVAGLRYPEPLMKGVYL